MKKLATAILTVGCICLLSATVTMSFSWSGTTEVIRSVELFDGKLEVVRTRGTGTMYPEGGEPPHYAYHDIYGVKNGKIVFEKTIEGKYYPESTRSVPSQFNWNR